MLHIALIALLLVAATVIVHVIGLAMLASRLQRDSQRPPGSGRFIKTLILMTWWLLLIHLSSITIWGSFFAWQGCMPDLESALYFAGTTYTTVGYGDVVLPKPWRLLGPIEGLTGILMCGLSTGFFFAVLTQMYQAWASSNANKTKSKRSVPRA